MAYNLNEVAMITGLTTRTLRNYLKLCLLKGEKIDGNWSFTEEELDMMYNGIDHHSDKQVKGHWFDEIIKDADAAQHALRNPMEDFFYDMPRIQQVLHELI